jgi:glycerol-3-phosphate dehydrogenase
LSLLKFIALLIRYKGENKMLFLSHDEKIKQLASHLAERLERELSQETSDEQMHVLIGYLFASHLIEHRPTGYYVRSQYPEQLKDLYETLHVHQ